LGRLAREANERQWRGPLVYKGVPCDEGGEVEEIVRAVFVPERPAGTEWSGDVHVLDAETVIATLM
jgi:hypothetical protein